MRKVICLILIGAHLSLVLAGCATPANKVSASYISPMQYASFDCEQIQQEMIRVSNKIKEVAGIQNKKATSDAWCTGIGLVLFWPAFFFMMGGDKKEELARLKGEYEALEQAGIQKKCVFIQDLEKARADAKQQSSK